MKAVIETITPSMAETYLEKNSCNRKIRQTHVYFLRDEIQGGRWQPNGATIVFGEHKLLDGQHRLLAVIAAKKPIRSLVVHGVPDQYFSTIDMGAPRRPSDTLTIKGEAHTGFLSSTIMWIIRYKESGLHVRRKISATAVEKFLEANGRVRKSVELCHGIKIMSGPVAAACHYLFSQLDETLADLMLDGIREGCKVDRNDPVYLFRERMVENLASKAKLHAVYQMAFMVDAWNLLRKKEKPDPSRYLSAHRTMDHGFPQII